MGEQYHHFMSNSNSIFFSKPCGHLVEHYHRLQVPLSIPILQRLHQDTSKSHRKRTTPMEVVEFWNGETNKNNMKIHLYPPPPKKKTWLLNLILNEEPCESHNQNIASQHPQEGKQQHPVVSVWRSAGQRRSSIIYQPGNATCWIFN